MQYFRKQIPGGGGSYPEVPASSFIIKIYNGNWASSCQIRQHNIRLCLITQFFPKNCKIVVSLGLFSSFFFFRKNYLLLSYATSVRLSVRPSVRLSVRLSSVEIISFHGISISNRPIDLKIGLDVCKGEVHVRKAWFFEILIASCKFMQFAIFCK